MPMEYETLFPLYWICGEWKSNRKSPPVTVFRDGGAYKIALTYHLDAVEVLSLIHISEPTRQAEISSAVICLKKK